MTGAIVATSLVFFPAAPLFLLVHGKDITIPKGTPITAYVNGDIELSAADFQHEPMKHQFAKATRSSTPPPSATPMLTNQDIIMLKQVGFSDEMVLTRIRSAPGRYNLDTGSLIELKNANVSEPLIQAMIQAGQK